MECGSVGVGLSSVQLHPSAVVVQCPIDHPMGDELGVAHDHVDQIAGGDAGVTKADLAHVAAYPRLKINEVADLERAFHEHRQAGEKIADDVLSAQADTDADRPGNDRK